jgi:putative selenate reductase
MTDKFTPTPLRQLMQSVLHQLDTCDSLFGIYKEQFFIPEKKDKFRINRYGRLLETPFGVAAGPHTQLTQNIVAAWLTGARYIELKTVQTLDELEISKPCIDMQDEGYNCEWSQELKIKESFDQYLNAWIIIHVLKDKLGIGDKDEPGFIFNMSVGYDLKGIMNENVQWFFDKMSDASFELVSKIFEVKDLYPKLATMTISQHISDNVTLSTMHGCPPDEIEQIAEYLISERKLHTSVKLNPTLLGNKDLRDIISSSGFDTDVPDIAFAHDLKYDEALIILNNLIELAEQNKVEFGVKLTNTLESKNNKSVFPEKEKMMYASGKVLHPISINLAKKLQNEFEGKLDISFSGGADAYNVENILQCGLSPVTVCTDLLKPGAYGRLSQYIDNISEFKAETDNGKYSEYLNSYADYVKKDIKYKKEGFKDKTIKTTKPLAKFDCIFAPCEYTCPTNQGIPSYMYYTTKGEYEKAYSVIKDTNPFANSTGMICDHTCQDKCTRINYDSPLLIRDIKRFVVEKIENSNKVSGEVVQPANGMKVSVIGAGPAGLSCSYFLKKAGFNITIYEENVSPGGMVSGAVPKFRLTDEALEFDINTIYELGISIKYGQKITEDFFENLRNESDFVFIAVGAQEAYKLNIPGSDAKGVLDPLEFLFDVKEDPEKNIGNNVIIIGGGNTAMDTARTVYRLVGEDGKLSVMYRRTKRQMPAQYKEIQDVSDEGIEIIELVSPLKVITENKKVKALKCIKMKLGENDESGRARPVEIKGSEFEIDCDTIIPAIGQSLSIDFVDIKLLRTEGTSYETKLENVFIGGDALRGASTLINAVGDGRKAAQEIINKAGIDLQTKGEKSIRQVPSAKEDLKNAMLKKSKRIDPVKVKETPIKDRKNFRQVRSVLSEEDARIEASRCLLCDEVCNICTIVCPNLALQSYEITPVKYNLQKVWGRVLVEDDNLEIKQANQIVHIVDWCNQCGNCETFCPTSGAPFKEKSHLYLSKKAYEKATEGYYYDSDAESLLSKENESEYSIEDEGEKWNYNNGTLKANIKKNTFEVKEFTCNDNQTHHLQKAVEMSLIMNAVKKLIKT